MTRTAAYGSWKSPITSDLIVAETIGIGGPDFDRDGITWRELRPTEGGRVVLVRRAAGGPVSDLTPEGFSVRTRVHEYGGGAHLQAGETLFFSNFSDQRLYRQDAGAAPLPITPEAELRYADGAYDARRGLLYYVREDHRGPDEAVNTLVKVRCDGDDVGGKVIVEGNDFYSSPRLSPDGLRLAWLTWRHPNMPWDGTELWVGVLDAAGWVMRKECVAGGPGESVFQPEWSPGGVLTFVSDRSGWWNLYRRRSGAVEPLCPMKAEFGEPQWNLGMSTYAYESEQRIVCSYLRHGFSHLAVLDTETLALTEVPVGYSYITGVRAAPGQVLFGAGSPAEPWSIVHLELATGRTEVLRRSSTVTIDPGYISLPQEIEFPAEEGQAAYGFFYPPRNRDFAAPEGERPPLLVMSHGGPTGATAPVLDEQIQYWTSRGIAVVDVNYGGSTGYGRAYRERLNGQWGVVDVDDCTNGALFLARRGDVDPQRLMITGGSAGGFTTLCALTFRDAFRAGASHYGIGDLETFAGDTHKFESRYLDRLVGPFPEQIELYRQRSAIRHTERLSCPLILFQGSDDKVVPPSQSRRMYEAVKAKGLPVAYLEFEGEQHGFRKAENIKRALDAELYFYSRVFGFALAEPVEPVEIANL
ncbi:MAG TPA: S9 family peptidase [Anaerolineae bacterium]|nr:S9 family peptidase [Anaerolineae bacterium]